MRWEKALKLFISLSVVALSSLLVGCSTHAVMGERATAAFEPTNSLLVVMDRKNFSIVNRPEGGFYENGIVANQLKLEQELKITLVEYLGRHGIASEFMGIPAVIGDVSEDALGWNSAIGKDKFRYLLVVSPREGVLHCRSGGLDCTATGRLEFRVTRRADGFVVWKGGVSGVGPAMLNSNSESPSSLVRQLTEKLALDGVIKPLAR